MYSLLAKPIERYQLLLGKYLGLVLTLAVNLSVMAGALYAVLAGMIWVGGSEMARALDRPAVDPFLLEAVALTFVGSRVVTALALFFSHLRPRFCRRPSPLVCSSRAGSAPTSATSSRSWTLPWPVFWRKRSIGSCPTWLPTTSGPRWSMGSR